MQDKESNGSSKRLVEIVARALCVADGYDPDEKEYMSDQSRSRWELYTDSAEPALTAIKEAGYAVVSREPTKRIIDAWVSTADLDASGMTDDEWEVAQATDIYRAMITAGEE